MSRRTILILLLVAALGTGGWLAWRKFAPSSQGQPKAAAVIEKQPVEFASRTFDPGNPPADMPPLNPGEAAECDTNFVSNALVGGGAEPTDATDAIVTVTHVKVTLGLHINIWTPVGASQHVIEHEEGHRQISEHYYATADKLAEQIASAYVGKQVLISGSDLNAELNKALEQMGSEITDEYNKELNPGPTQLRYDAITDHSLNSVAANDAVEQALKESAAPAQPTANPGN